MPTYQFSERLQIDLGHGGSYTHAYADMTGRLKSLTVSLGFNDPYAEVAPPSKMEFKLLNADRYLTPDNSSSPLYGLLTRGTLVKYTASWNGTAYVTWIGKITKVVPNVHPHTSPSNNFQVTVTAEDPMLQLLDAQIFPRLQTNVLVHNALASIMDEIEGQIVYPYESTYAVIDVSVIDTARIVSNDLFTYSVSTTEIEYVGDNSADAKGTVGAQSLIRDIMQAELGGRFFWNGQKFEFQDRYYSAELALSAATLTLYSSDIVEWDYRYGDDIVNDVTVNFQPRQVGVAGTVVYSSERAIAISAGATRTVTCHFRDPDTPNARIGATDVLPVVAGTDYVANFASDGSSTNVTAYVNVFVDAGGQSATIAITNTLTATVYITTLQLRATPLYTYERESVSVADAQSINDHGRYPKSYTLKLITDEATAEGFANIQAQRFRNHASRLNSVTVIANSQKLVTTDVSIGDVITITENTATTHNEQYAVVGIRHQIDGRSREHKITYTLSPLNRNQYWVLGVSGASELDSTAILAL